MRKNLDTIEIRKEKMFEERVIKSEGNECWEWKGYKFSDGYCGFKLNKKLEKSHRISWELHFGEIPKGLIVGHHCDNRGCSNPKHLFLSTHAHNSRDMVRKKRQAYGSKNGSAKLNEEIVFDIRKRMEKGERPIFLAKEFNVHKCTMYKIKNKTIWKNIGVTV